jgi:hypothetical protein
MFVLYSHLSYLRVYTCLLWRWLYLLSPIWYIFYYYIFYVVIFYIHVHYLPYDMRHHMGDGLYSISYHMDIIIFHTTLLHGPISYHIISYHIISYHIIEYKSYEGEYPINYNYLIYHNTPV